MMFTDADIDFELLFVVLFGLIILIQAFYYLFIFGRFSFAKKLASESNSSKKNPVSVIVCAKNEAENVIANIPVLLNQKYSAGFELVLVNDESYDETLPIFEKFEKEHANVKIVDVRHFETGSNWSSKKYALMLGIKAAKYNHLLFIDADCKPASDQWISHMASQFTDTKKIVLGYGAYQTNPGWLNKLIRFETVLTSLQYFSWAKAKNPYMGVGRNLAYTKDLFFENNGFAEHMKILSGDDDLFINGAATSKNTGWTYDVSSFTYSIAKKHFGEWIYQKRRHISTATFYKPKDKFILSLFYISQFAFLVGAVALLCLQFLPEIVIGLIGFRYVFTYLSVGFANKKLNEKGLTLWYPFLEITLIFSQLYLFMTNFFIKVNHWR